MSSNPVVPQVNRPNSPEVAVRQRPVPAVPRQPPETRFEAQVQSAVSGKAVTQSPDASVPDAPTNLPDAPVKAQVQVDESASPSVAGGVDITDDSFLYKGNERETRLEKNVLVV